MHIKQLKLWIENLNRSFKYKRKQVWQRHLYKILSSRMAMKWSIRSPPSHTKCQQRSEAGTPATQSSLMITSQSPNAKRCPMHFRWTIYHQVWLISIWQTIQSQCSITKRSESYLNFVNLRYMYIHFFWLSSFRSNLIFIRTFPAFKVRIIIICQKFRYL